MNAIITDADGLMRNEEDGVVVLAISRKEIEEQNYTSALERLMVLSDSDMNIWRYRESLCIWVQGYDEDVRELGEIPEVRSYFAKLVVEWPLWPWFLAQGIEQNALLISLLCTFDITRHENGDIAVQLHSEDEARDTIVDLTSRTKALLLGFGIEEASIDATLTDATSEMFGG